MVAVEGHVCQRRTAAIITYPAAIRKLTCAEGHICQGWTAVQAAHPAAVSRPSPLEFAVAGEGDVRQGRAAGSFHIPPPDMPSCH